MIIHGLPRIRELLKAKKLDAIILFNTSRNKVDYSLRYAVNADIEHGVLMIKHKNQLRVPKFEVERVKAELRREKDIEVKGIKDNLFADLGRKVKGTVGINKSSVSLLEYAFLRKYVKVKFVDISKELKEIRRTKSRAEVEKIRKAAAIGDKIFKELLVLLRRKAKKISEKDVANFIKRRADDHDAEDSFEPIVASGKGSAEAHHTNSNKKLANGFCVLDFGVKYKGYCSDMTRTVYIGKASDSEKEAYYKVLNVLNLSIDMVKEKEKCRKIDDFARRILGKEFNHSLGHGIGVEVHEGPIISGKSKDKFERGQAFTIEPGIYINNKHGIRIEDDLWINERGKVEVLTKSEKKLIEIKV